MAIEIREGLCIEQQARCMPYLDIYPLFKAIIIRLISMFNFDSRVQNHNFWLVNVVSHVCGYYVCTVCVCVCVCEYVCVCVVWCDV